MVSFIWNQQYNGVSDFEVELMYTSENIGYCSLGNYIWTNQTDDRLMIIEEITLKANDDSFPTLLIKGRSLETILGFRVIQANSIVSGNVQTIIKNLINDNIIDPDDTKRKISNFVFDEDTDDAVLTTLEIDKTEIKLGANLLTDVLVPICQQTGIGFEMYVPDDNNFHIRLYNGANRSYSQETNPWVVLSSTYDNLTDSSFLIKSTPYRNYTIVAGEEVDGNKTLTSAYIGEEPEGMYRREMYTDSSGISQTIDDVKMSNADYLEVLQSSGIEQLNKNKIIQLFDGTLIGDGELEFKKDYNLGDIVQAENEFGGYFESRISEIIYALDRNGFRIYPGFTKIEESED